MGLKGLKEWTHTFLVRIVQQCSRNPSHRTRGGIGRVLRAFPAIALPTLTTYAVVSLLLGRCWIVDDMGGFPSLSAVLSIISNERRAALRCGDINVFDVASICSNRIASTVLWLLRAS